MAVSTLMFCVALSMAGYATCAQGCDSSIAGGYALSTGIASVVWFIIGAVIVSNDDGFQ